MQNIAGKNSMNILFYTNPEVKNDIIKDFVDDLSKKYSINEPIYTKVITDDYVKKDNKKNYDYIFKILSKSTVKNQYTDLTWTLPSTILGTNKFKKCCHPNKTTAQIITCGRTGTMLFDTVLRNNYKRVYAHAVINPNTDLSKLRNPIKEEKVFTNKIQGDDIFFIYRTDWLEHFTSHLLGQKYGYNHENLHDYSDHKTIRANVKKEINNFVKSIFAYFNTICNYTKLHETKFKAIITYEDVVSYYSKLGVHKKINYGKPKKQFFEQWDEIKKYVGYATPKLDEIRQNALDKLRQMNVMTIKNLDEIM